MNTELYLGLRGSLVLPLSLPLSGIQYPPDARLDVQSCVGIANAYAKFKTKTIS